MSVTSFVQIFKESLVSLISQVYLLLKEDGFSSIFLCRRKKKRQLIYFVPTSSARKSYGEVCHIVYWPCFTYLLNTRQKWSHIQVCSRETRTSDSRTSAQVPLEDILRPGIRNIKPSRDQSPILILVVAMLFWHLATEQELREAFTKPFLYWYYSSFHFSILISIRKNYQQSWISLYIYQTPDWQQHPKLFLFNPNNICNSFVKLSQVCVKTSHEPPNSTSWRTNATVYITTYLHKNISFPLKTWKMFMLTSSSLKDILALGYWLCWLQYLR